MLIRRIAFDLEGNRFVVVNERRQIVDSATVASIKTAAIDAAANRGASDFELSTSEDIHMVVPESLVAAMQAITAAERHLDAMSFDPENGSYIDQLKARIAETIHPGLRI